MEKERNAGLSEIPDGVLYEEVAIRLQTEFSRRFGKELQYGSFRFLFHKGRFLGVEELPKTRSYISDERSYHWPRENE